MTTRHTADAPDLSRWLRPGDRIVIAQGCGEPQTLVGALAAQAGAIGGLSAFVGTSFSGLLTPALAADVALSSFGAVGALRQVARAGRLGIVPCHFGQIAPLIRERLIGCDVAFVQVSPADADGNHSYGLNGDYIDAAVRRARIVIAEVNEQMPFTFGDRMLAAGRIDLAVAVSRSPVTVTPAALGDTDRAIAHRVAGFIGDGAVLQIGVGAVPDAVLRQLRDRRDLGIHSGMIGDGLVDLVEAGVVTNARKPADRGVSIVGALIGTGRLFRFAHRNPALGLRSTDATHAEAVLAAIPGLVSINSGVEVDLTGQVNAEQAVDRYLGGAGGQIDFTRGAARAPGGRAIVALPSTAGDASRIVARLDGPVTTARSEADVIVTEHGAAELKGQTLAERARRMAAIAHPDHRAALEEAAWAIARRGY